MLEKLWSHILGSVHGQPEVVCWSRDTRGHSSDKSGKQLIHKDIILDLSAPHFNKDESWVYLVISNAGRKALGFGAAGIGLVLTTGKQTATLQCMALRQVGRFNQEKESQTLMVDAGCLHFHFVALFGAASEPDCSEVVIQANRILAAPYFFRVPFEAEVPPGNPSESFEELLKLDPAKVRKIRVRPNDRVKLNP
jgi:hypothetical protein